ncbi:MAG: XTP/dITP diphosphohydrolase [Candidatus Arcticimaribacter sp.]|jgi:XTP/dITP diphosphohydrolase
MKLVFATHNLNKLKEVKEMVPEGIEILSLSDINCTEEIEETGTTLEENARIKVTYVKDHYGYDCFSDDSGLEIDSLNGAPGVYSARYAGEDKNNDNNIKKVWKNLKDKENKNGQFRTIIAADIKGKKSLFEGIIRGTLINEKRGDGGFGYDPIFVPTGHSKTFAELEKKVKNIISHRAKAFSFFVKDLNSAI